MTGRSPDDEEGDHLVIHWDGGDDGEEVAPPALEELELEPQFQPSLVQRYRYWLYAALIVGLLGATGYVIGDTTYNPPSRLPAFTFDTSEPLYGTNATVAAELDIVRETFSETGALELEPAGSVFHLPLPRTVGDRLFGERDEAITVFIADGPAGEHRFLLLNGDDNEGTFAIEAPLGLSSRERPNGIFLVLDAADPVFGPLVGALEAMLPAVEDQPLEELSPNGFYTFGPYQGGDTNALRARIEDSIVMTHLAEAIEAAGGDVSVSAPVLLVGSGPSRGTINAVYHPARRVVMEPLWGASTTGSLAHELVHAYLDAVVADEGEVLTEAAGYLERAHPVLHGEVVGDLYERLGREGRAEESLAFITGAIAAQQTKTVSTQRLLENTGNLAISEAIFYSDVELLVRFGLLPRCMLPNEGARGELSQSYYEAVAAMCE